jgi:hypothetical protein
MVAATFLVGPANTFWHFVSPSAVTFVVLAGHSIFLTSAAVTVVVDSHCMSLPSPETFSEPSGQCQSNVALFIFEMSEPSPEYVSVFLSDSESSFDATSDFFCDAPISAATPPAPVNSSSKTIAIIATRRAGKPPPPASPRRGSMNGYGFGAAGACCGGGWTGFCGAELCVRS